MKLVVKIGGQAQEDAAVRKGVARQIAALARAGNRVVVVHGGGKLLTQTLEQLGIRSEFHHGLRVTDARTRDVALMVLAGNISISTRTILPPRSLPPSLPTGSYILPNRAACGTPRQSSFRS